MAAGQRVFLCWSCRLSDSDATLTRHLIFTGKQLTRVTWLLLLLLLVSLLLLLLLFPLSLLEPLSDLREQESLCSFECAYISVSLLHHIQQTSQRAPTAISAGRRGYRCSFSSDSCEQSRWSVVSQSRVCCQWMEWCRAAWLFADSIIVVSLMPRTFRLVTSHSIRTDSSIDTVVVYTSRDGRSDSLRYLSAKSSSMRHGYIEIQSYRY